MVEILLGDITTLAVDAIVNAANSDLRGGGGVDGAIHQAAGPKLLAELRHYSGCPTGSAVLTRGYDLPARYVIHAVGPIWRGGGHDEAALLANAYESALRLARGQGDVRTIAFPAISTGIYAFPKPDAARIALAALRAHAHEFDRVIACLFDEDSRRIYEAVLAETR